MFTRVVAGFGLEILRGSQLDTTSALRCDEALQPGRKPSSREQAERLAVSNFFYEAEE